MKRVLLLFLMLLVVVSPLPLGSNREWSWSLCALIAGVLTLAWLVSRGWRKSESRRFVHPAIPLLFIGACGWIVFQLSLFSPGAWHHPLWSMTADLPGMISLSADDGWMALMRLLSYTLVFFLAFQLASERSRAYAMLGWITTAGVLYGVFGLLVEWGLHQPAWLFGENTVTSALRSTFVNRNHFATWQGLALLAATTLFLLRMNGNSNRPYTLAADRETWVEQFVLKSWKPLLGLLLMTTALVLTHSRGGFLATLAGAAVLLYLLDARSEKRALSNRLTGVVVLGVCGLAFYLTSEVLLERIDQTVVRNEDRVVVYEQVRQGVSENPVLGFGYGTFADTFRLYDRVETPVHFDRAHNTWLENLFELGIPSALALFAAIAGLALTCLKGWKRRRRDWAIPALGVASSVLVGVHALFDFSLQIPAVAILYACIMGIACAQSHSSQAT
jgi:O-antigen ligase